MTLEIPTGKTPGTVVRRTEAPRPAIVGFMILCLTGLIFVFAALVFATVYDWSGGAPTLAKLSASDHDPAIPEFTIDLYFQELSFWTSEQVMVSFWLACMFFCLFEAILLYQRYFTDHVTIAKKRFRKWEDEGVQLRG